MLMEAMLLHWLVSVCEGEEGEGGREGERERERERGRERERERGGGERWLAS